MSSNREGEAVHDHGAVNLWFVLTRAGHFASCLLIAGVFAFDRMVATTAPAASAHWRKIAMRLLIASFPVALLTGMWWLAMVAIEMSELPPREALTPQVLEDVWNQTHFGGVWKLRLGLYLGAAIVGILSCGLSLRTSEVQAGKPAPQMAGSLLSWLALLLTGGLCASLAWAGHAQVNRWSLASDAVHLSASAVWPAGLVPLAMLLWQLRKMEEWSSIATLVHRFSQISVVVVLLLIASGILNSVYLVGSWLALVSSGYGITLLVKIALFGLTIIFGAVNLLYLRPRLATRDSIEGDAPALQTSVAMEIGLMVFVIAVVGVLGLLPPGTG